MSTPNDAESSQRLPVHAAKGAFLAALERGPVVLSSPTGSGKSTEVPRWCPGPVLVIEPRRIACRSLAMRVAELEGTAVGDGVGYVVRDERVMRSSTRIVFATPGIALRDRALLASAGTILLDEFHERSLEVDLLLALLLEEKRSGLVVMSATLEGERVAAHLRGEHVSAEGRTFPVELRYLEGPEVLPTRQDLPQRVRTAVDAALRDAGDILVFLPGKAEIDACAAALEGKPISIVPLHGSLSLDEQRRAFSSTPRRKVILATNVAETSLTIPGVGVVIDSGLVRQTRYHDGRGFLTLVPIAEDSAAQRSGRAGRTGPGVGYRLWSAKALLHAITAPEIHRESLVPLVMASAAWGKRVEDLRLLDPPKPYALEAARADLLAWDALEGDHALSDGGRGLFSLPVAPEHARLLLAAKREGCGADMLDLVAALSTGRPMFTFEREDVGGPDDLSVSGCDATALITAMRAERPRDHGISGFALSEAKSARSRLLRIEGLGAPSSEASQRIDREGLIRAAIAADPRLVYVARPKGRETFFSNGGTEIELSRESAVRRLKNVEALLVLATRAFGAGRDQRILVTCGMAIPLSVVARAGLGTERLAGVSVEGKRVVSSIERVYANKVIAVREDVPTGALAREAFVTLLLRGSLFKEAIRHARSAFARGALGAKLEREKGGASGATREAGATKRDAAASTFEAWIEERIAELGIESGDDLPMLSASDFAVPELPYELRERLERDFPAEVSVGDATYRADYDLDRSEVVLEMIKGSRKEPPPIAYLPKFAGLKVAVRTARGLTVLRERGR